MERNSLINKLKNSRVFWIAVSVLTSLAIWVYITSVESDETSKTFRNVRVEVIGEDALESAKNMVVTELDTSTVNIEVTGSRRAVAKLKADDIVAQIDVSKLSRSAYMTQAYDIVYADGVDTNGLSVTSRSPETVSFLVSELKTVSIPVRGSFDGDVGDGHTAESPSFEPSTVDITGPASYVDAVSYAWVTFGQNAGVIEKTYRENTGYTLMDQYGEQCDVTDIYTSTDIITAELEIFDIKEIPLAVDLVEGAGATSANTKVTIEPKTVTLSGDSELLTGLNKIVLATIDLTDFKTSFTETYTITINNELKNVTGITEAAVTVEVVGLETRTFKVNNFSCINDSVGYVSNIKTESIEVTLRGPADQLDKIKSEDIRAVVDLTDYVESAGTFAPEAKIKIDTEGTADVGSLGDYVLSVEIKRA